MTKFILSFLVRNFPAWICFIKAYLFYIGIDTTGIGVELHTREEFIENAWLWFYGGIFFLFVVEFIDYKFYSKKTTFCYLINLLATLYLIAHIFSILNDIYFIVLMPVLFYFIYDCYKNKK